MRILPGSQSSPSPSRIKLHFLTMMPCLIMCPLLVAFSTLSYFPALLFYLPSEFLASESLSQDLTSGEPKLSHYLGIIQYILSSPVALAVKNLPANAADTRDLGSTPGLGRSPGGGNGNPLRYSYLEKSNGQRSLAGYSPWGCKESDMTENLCIYNI